MEAPRLERIVACFRWRGAAASIPESEQYASAAGSLIDRAEKLGAQVVGWHAASFAVAFAPESLEGLVELLTSDETHALGFSIGVSQGALGSVGAARDRLELAWGPPLVVAWALARVARAGEVLIDPELEAVREERLLVRGSRIGLLGSARVRGARLDLRHPFQPAHGFPSVALVRSRYLGRDPVAPPPGTLGLLTGRRGSGGTRWLEQLAARERERRVLWLRPRLGEPLGSLRRALARAVEAAAELEPELGESLESLLAGEGLDIDTTAELLGALLRRDGQPGLVLIDDAEHVDADSLEALVHGCRSAAYGVVARVVDGLAVPEPFHHLTRTFQVDLDALPPDDAAALVSELTSGRVKGADAGRWATRGDGLPLGIVAAVADAIESKELVARDDSLVPPPDSPIRTGARSPLGLTGRRIRRWDPAVRAVLSALAVLGGDSEEEEVAALLALVHETPPDETMLHTLEAAELIRRDGVHLTLSSATLRSALTDSLGEAERARLHRAASAVLAGGDLVLGSVAAAVHSMLGGDVDRALPLARRGAAALRAAGLEETAECLGAFSETGDPELARARGLFSGARTERAGLQRSDVPPPLSLDSTIPLSDRPSRLPPSGEEVAQRFTQALKHGDSGAMEVLAAELRDDGSQQVIADRLEGMASLVRGQVSDALRRLRHGKELAASHSPGDRSRAALALGVALAAAGRNTEALLEGLEALARARDASDHRGELACARFLARLSEGGQCEEATRRWEMVAVRAAAR